MSNHIKNLAPNTRFNSTNQSINNSICPDGFTREFVYYSDDSDPTNTDTAKKTNSTSHSPSRSSRGNAKNRSRKSLNQVKNTRNRRNSNSGHPPKSTISQSTSNTKKRSSNGRLKNNQGSQVDELKVIQPTINVNQVTTHNLVSTVGNKMEIEDNPYVDKNNSRLRNNSDCNDNDDNDDKEATDDYHEGDKEATDVDDDLVGEDDYDNEDAYSSKGIASGNISGKSHVELTTPLIQYFRNNNNISDQQKRNMNNCLEICTRYKKNSSILGLVNVINTLYADNVSYSRTNQIHKQQQKKEENMDRRENDFDMFLQFCSMNLFKTSFALVSTNSSILHMFCFVLLIFQYINIFVSSLVVSSLTQHVSQA